LKYLLNSNDYSIPFSIFIEDYKYLYIISKLIKKIYGKEWGFIRQQEEIYKLIKNSLTYKSFHVFIFDKNGKLVSGNMVVELMLKVFYNFLLYYFI